MTIAPQTDPQDRFDFLVRNRFAELYKRRYQRQADAAMLTGEDRMFTVREEGAVICGFLAYGAIYRRRRSFAVSGNVKSVAVESAFDRVYPLLGRLVIAKVKADMKIEILAAKRAALRIA